MRLFFAITFPFLVFLAEDRVIAALIAFLLQLSFIGWPIAIFWAVQFHRELRREEIAEKKRQEQEKPQ